MATIALTKNTNGTFLWETVTGDDVGEALELPNGGAQLAVQVTGTFGAAVTMEGTIDGTNWFGLTAGPGGSAISLEAAGYAEISTAAKAVRPAAASSVSDVDVSLNVVA